MMFGFVALALACAIGYPILLIALWRKLAAARAVSAKYAPLANLDAEVARLTSERDARFAEINTMSRQLAELKADVVQTGATVEMQAIGLYRRQFDFRDAAEYKRKLDQLRDSQEAMVKADMAAECSSNWTINGSASEGRKVTTKILKLMLRAFNGECDALISHVRYDNIATYRLRIEKSFASINKLGSGFTCAIADDYLRFKLAELAMVHEYQEQLQAEKEEQRRIREEMREEQRRTEELERLKREAADDEKKYLKLLDRARVEAAAAEGERRTRLETHVAELEAKLAEAQAKAERAKSLAQMTRAGHVYILSNIGSFGEQVIKIGMTRRLEPQERVDELSDASVPFCFDVHAMIYSEDAPRLERALHELLTAHRVNRVNLRKEFFRATLDDIEALVRKHHGEFKLTKVAEAIEYRKTLALIEEAEKALAGNAGAGKVSAQAGN